MGKRFEITDALVIGYFTILGYLIVYYYELGIAEFFMYPKELIQVSFQTIMKDSAELVTILVMVFFALNLYFIMQPDSIRFRIAFFIIWYSSNSLLLAIYSGSDSIVILLHIALIVCFIGWGYVYPLIKYRKIKGFNNKYIKAIEEYDEKRAKDPNKGRDLMSKGVVFGGKVLVFALIIPLYTHFLSDYAVGRYERKKSFNIAQYNKVDYIVANKYEDYIIVAPIDLKTNIVKPEYQVLSINDDYEIRVIKDIGTITISQ